MVEASYIMNVGIIGCGKVAPKHADAYKEIRKYAHFHFCDIIRDRASGMAGTYNDIAKKVEVHRDYKVMLENVDLDLVSVCTPPSTHMEIVRDCISSGVNVICEKPIDISYDRANKMAVLCHRAIVKTAIIFQHRWHPEVQNLKASAYKDWQPFKVSMTVNWYRPDNYFEDWKGVLSMGGDVVFNQVIHHLDILRYIFGDVKSVFAYVKNTRPEIISCMDVCQAVLKFESGLTGVLDATINCVPENERTELVVITDKGSFSIVPKGTSHLHQIKHVIECIEKDEQPEVRPEDALESLKLAIAIHESAWSGKEVHL